MSWTILTYCLFFAVNVFAMEFSHPLQSPMKNKIFTTNSDDDCGLELVKNSLDKAGKGDQVSVMMFALTDKALMEKLKNTQDRGARVRLILCASQLTEDTKRELNTKKLEYRIFNPKKERINSQTKNPQMFHKKTVLWTYTTENGEQHPRFWIGSRNLTNLAKSSKKNEDANKEIMLYSTDDKESFQEQSKQFEEYWNMSRPATELPALSPKKEQFINYDKNPSIQTTPKKMSVLASDKININGSLAKMINHADKNLRMHYYNIDDPQVLTALIQAAKRNVEIEIIVNGTALSSERKVTNLLAVQNAGAKIFVFNADERYKKGKYPLSDHLKNLIREQKDSKKTVAISELNATLQNNSDVGSMYIVPNDAEKYEECVKEFNKARAQSVRLDYALKLKGFGMVPEKRKMAAASIDVADNKKLKISEDPRINKMLSIAQFCEDGLRSNELNLTTIRHQLKQLKETVDSNNSASAKFLATYTECRSRLEALKKRLENTVID